MKYLALSSFALLAAAGSVNKGALTVTVNGQDQTFYVVGTNEWVGTTTSGSSVTLQHGDRAYLSTQSEDSLNPDNFYTFSMMGTTVEYDVTFNGVSCSCNAAIYTVQMPGRQQDGTPNPGSGDYYCDANDGNGQWCPEMDLFEANENVIAMTPHKCDDPGSSQEYWNCDRDGCQTNTWYVDSGMFGLGKQIDTSRTFHHSTSYNGCGDSIDSISATLSQDSNSRTFGVCGQYDYQS